jgi:hypothetical protein
LTLAYTITFYLKRGDIGRASLVSGYSQPLLRRLLEGRGSKTYPNRKLILAIQHLGELTVENLKTIPLDQLPKHQMHLHDLWQAVHKTQAAIAEQLAVATVNAHDQALIEPVKPLSDFVEQSTFLAQVTTPQPA